MGTQQPTDVTSLADTARHHIDLARQADHGRSARTVRGGHDRALRQTVVALRAGVTLHEHESPREATLQVLAGRIRLEDRERTIEVGAGDLLAVPGTEHTLRAVEDSALLLTVSLVLGEPVPAAAAGGGGTVYSWQEDWS